MKTIPNHPNYAITKDGKVWSKKREIWLQSGLGSGGCLKVSLCTNGKKYTRKIHQLVLETYIGFRKKGQECRHLNGNCKDNWVENLRWGTSSENSFDSVKHGTCNVCVNKPAAKLTNENVRGIRKMLRDKIKQHIIGMAFGVTKQAISAINTGKNWAEKERVEL